jgi:hypothetical protein
MLVLNLLSKFASLLCCFFIFSELGPFDAGASARGFEVGNQDESDIDADFAPAENYQAGGDGV